jgi:DnaJ-class molecular chaperone
MFKRVNIDGPGDDPDEYWFECPDCEGNGAVGVPDLEEDPEGRLTVEATCPVCNGSGRIEGDSDDADT